MLRHYIVTGWKNLWRNRFYTLINISGLAMGLATGVLILLWVQGELSFDRFHKNAHRIYKINSHPPKVSSSQTWATAPAALKPLAMKTVPGVADVVRIRSRDKLLFSHDNNHFIENRTAYIDSSFFAVFDFKSIKGDIKRTFSDNQSVILTNSLAKKYFGDSDVIGKTLRIEKEIFSVSAIIEDFPQNSSIQFTALFPMRQFDRWLIEGGGGEWPLSDEDFGDFSYYVYFLLDRNTSPDVVGEKVSDAYAKRVPHDQFAFELQPLTTTHLMPAGNDNSGLQTVKIFLIIGILILVVASINYVNLSTARSMLRSKEVSTRKIIGATRMHLFLQFVVETVLLFLIAGLLACSLIWLLVPVYNTISGRSLQIGMAGSDVWIPIVSALLFTLLLSAVYPAALLSSFKPLDTLRGKLLLGFDSTSVRKTLVVLQFVFSAGMITATIVISSQMKYMKEMRLGFDKQHVFSFTMRDEMRDHYEIVRNELLKKPGVLGVASTDYPIVHSFTNTGGIDWEGRNPYTNFLYHVNGLDKDIVSLLGMKLSAGRNFTGSKADSAHFILNETAVAQTGMKDPIGKRFSYADRKGTIIGVVQDFNISSLKEKILPAIFYHGYPTNHAVYVKTTGVGAKDAIASAETIWKNYSPDHPFEYAFLDDTINSMYHSDERTANLFRAFAIVAILISCLGLFGLATFTAQVKTKEIGIRKILGASTWSIAELLTREFILLVVVALVIAFPIAWYAMNKWLDNYAYAISINGKTFLIAAFVSLLIALITISFQSMKAALENPVKSLRSE